MIVSRRPSGIGQKPSIAHADWMSDPCHEQPFRKRSDTSFQETNMSKLRTRRKQSASTCALRGDAFCTLPTGKAS